ncbi:hypothetical protein [Actibacterium lipolyticum]|uniref:Uncharacterized protein n=1 Tax=Actibacterium lipolyticum TaxID=1524263 RepID=A0A238JY02_9RHOB|nr:hypothetical protein [Actibacterium lipolyticum]SMX35004.1 hypothetical protein COL8621_01601 [Actibacterium lipolyticum]
MTRILCLTGVLLSATALPSFAETLNCAFTSECFATDACQETAFHLEMADDGAGWTLSSVAGDTSMSAVAGDSVALRAFVSPVTADTLHLLSVFEDGSAFYATNSWYGEPVNVSYHGTCEGAD